MGSSDDMMDMACAMFSDGVPMSAAMVTMDQADYQPGATAHVTGTGFVPNETVTLEVVHRDTLQPGAGDNPWSVTVSADGSFSSTWYVNPVDSVGASFILSATGSQGDSASTTFTDAGPVYPFYATGSGGTTLVSINQNTGVATTIGSLGYSNTFTGAFTPDGTFWTIVNSLSGASQLARVNLSTGQATPVGAPPLSDQILAMDANPAGQLYAGSHSGTFYSVNTSTGVFTKLDQLSIYTCDFAFDNSGNLWAVDGSTTLYQLNPSTGAVLSRTPMSGLAAGVMSIEVDPSNDFYVATYSSPSQLYLLNPTTGATTLVGTNLGVGFVHGGDFLPTGVPTISGLSSTSAVEGGASFTITVNGTNFANPSTVQWNGTALATSFFSTTQLQAVVPAANLAEEGSASITVVSAAGTSNPQTFTVQDAPLSAVANVAFNATEGTPFSGTIASFTDTDPGTATDPTTNPADYSATITWGDGTTSPGTIAYAGTPGNFTVNASGAPHTYAEEGAQVGSFNVTIHHGTLADVSTPGIPVTVSEQLVVVTGGFSLSATEGTLSAVQTVATFTDPAGAEALSKYAAAIDWGDGSTSPGTISYSGTLGSTTGVFTIQGSHEYAEEGAYPVAATISHDSTLANPPLVSASSQVVIADAPPVLSLPTNLTVEATSAQGVAVIFAASASDYDDGPVPVSSAPASGSQFPLGTTTVTATARNADGTTTTGSFTVTVRDTTPPALALPPDQTFESPQGTSIIVHFTPATATDLVTANPTISYFVGGTPITNDSLFPLGTTTVTVTAADAAGNTSTGIFHVTVRDTTPPTVLSTAPDLTPGTLAAGTTSLQVNYSEAVVGAATASNYELRSQGPDGLLGTADDPILTITPSYSGTTATLNFAALPVGVYRLTVKSAITDTSGNALASFVRDFVVMATPTTPLTSPNGFTFDPQMDGFGAGQLVQGTNNAFDGLNRLQVGGTDYTPAASVVPAATAAEATSLASAGFGGGAAWYSVPGLTQTVTTTAASTPVAVGASVYGYFYSNTLVRVLVDGSPTPAGPRWYQFQGGTNTTLAYDDVVNLGPGAHTVSVQVEDLNGGFSVFPANDNATGTNIPNSLRAVAYNQLPYPTLTNGGQTLVTNTQTLAGLNVSRQVTVPNAGGQDFARTVDYFQNPTGSPITTTVTVVGNLGSDAATHVFATATGGSTPGVNDEWFGTDGGPSTTALVHVVHGPAGLKPAAVSLVGDNIEWTYTITVQPGQTVELGTFTIQASS
jgi:hypothetical protein